MHILDSKFYPVADEWMWDYCTYLGSGIYNNSKEKLDLGVHVSSDKKNVSFAIVYGNEPGNYASGSIYFNGKFQPNWFRTFKHPNFKDHWDTYKLAKKANLFKEMSFTIQNDDHLSCLFHRLEDCHLEMEQTHDFYLYHGHNRFQGFIYNFIGFLGFQDKDGHTLKYDFFEIIPKEVKNEQNSCCDC